MKFRLLFPVILACSLLAPLILADTPPAPKLDEPTRMALIRGLNAELVFIRRTFPMGDKGLTIKNGQVYPDEMEVKRLIATYGPSIKPGDRAQITDIKFQEKQIIFEINGGPVKKQKWYQRIQVGGGGGGMVPVDQSKPTNNARGSLAVLTFDKYVPKLSVDDVKKLLYPVFDFHAMSAAEAYMDTLPPKVKEAIKNHQVLVGMNRDMVTYALGRPPRKHREQDATGKEYEEWIYGQPPQEVQFVRFVGEEVVRLEIMKVNGQKIVRVDREMEIPRPTVAEGETPPQPTAAQMPTVSGGGDTQASPKPANAPTLRRPGEAPPVVNPADIYTGPNKLPTPPPDGTTPKPDDAPRIPH